MNNIAQEPAQLIQRYREGDPRAARQLYDRYAGAMYNICLRMLNDELLAEDMLQEAFLQVFRNLDAYRGEATVGAWIKSIVVNKCLNQLKKKKWFFEPVEAIEVEDEPAPDEEAFTYTVNKVQEAIRQLPEGYRAVLNLYLFEGYSHKAIAEMLDISESTAKTQYMRAKAKVRQLVSIAISQ